MQESVGEWRGAANLFYSENEKNMIHESMQIDTRLIPDYKTAKYEILFVDRSEGARGFKIGDYLLIKKGCDVASGDRVIIQVDERYALRVVRKGRNGKQLHSWSFMPLPGSRAQPIIATPEQMYGKLILHIPGESEEEWKVEPIQK